MLADAVRRTLESLDLTPADHAAQELAVTLANELDSRPEPADFARFSAQLAAILAELGATPAARARIASHRRATDAAPQTVANPLTAFRMRAVK